MTRRTVLIDLTCLQTTQRFRGIGRYTADLATGLAEAAREARAADVRVVGLAWLDARGHATFTDESLQVPRLFEDGALDANDLPARWRRRLFVSAAARKVGAPFVHVVDPRGTPLGLVKRVVTCHDLIPLRFPDRYLNWKDGYSPVRRARDVRRYRGAAHVIAISEETRRDLERFVDVRGDAVSVVYNGIDLSRWSDVALEADAAVRKKHGLERPYVLYVGASEWRKNPDNMLASLVHAPGVELVWAGKVSPLDTPRLEAEATRLGVRDRVRFIGYVDDVELAALYRGSIAHLFVSRAEGFGLTVVEAMACGTPVVTTSGTSLGEVAGDAAISVDPEDARAIGEAIVRVQNDATLRRHLHDVGIARAQRFSALECGRGTRAVYERLFA